MSQARKFMESLVGPVTVGMLIRAFRSRMDLTLEQLGEMVGQSASYMSDLERDKKSISLAQIKDIAERMGESIEHYVIAWIRQELNEAHIKMDVELRPITGEESLFAQVRKATSKPRAKKLPLAQAKKTTKRRAS